MQQRMMAVFLTLSMLLVSASGCLGLLQSREYMEQLRGDVELATTTKTAEVKHVFLSPLVDEEWNERFTVDSEVSRIGVYFKTTMVLDDSLAAAGVELRAVEVKITDAAGNLRYNATHQSTKTAPYFLIEPNADGKFSAGEWNINIVGDGMYFPDPIGSDEFLLTVDVTRTCTIYPQDEICVVD